MKIIKISKGETVNKSSRFKNRKTDKANNSLNPNVFLFDQKPWQRVRKTYKVIILVLVAVAFYCIIFPPAEVKIFWFVLMIITLLVFLNEAVILPKKYFLKIVRLSRRTIEFEYYNSTKFQFRFPKKKVYFYVYAYEKSVEIAYSGHKIIFTNPTEMTTFLNHVIELAGLEFYKSTELGMNKELLEYKVTRK